jgi:hypothetical protein
MKTCPNCAKKIQDKATTCPYCGKPLTPSLIDRLKTNMKYRVGLILGVVGLVAIISGGIYLARLNGLFGPSCYVQSQAYLTDFTPLFSQWNEANQNVQSLNKNDLEIAEFSMESIREQIGALTPPRCARKAQTLILSYMDNTLDGYNAFISSEPEGTVKSYIEEAANHYAQYHTEVLKIYPELSETSTPTP